MADITSLQSGAVNDSEKVNWRGDQVATPQGGQSIYKSSTVPLAELGSRLVVGDRVFRYAQCGLVPPNAGDLVELGAGFVLSVTGAATGGIAGDKAIYWFSTTNVAKDYWAEGSICANSGTATSVGFQYRIKSHAAIATTSTGTLLLYDPLVVSNAATSKWSIFQNPYKGVTQMTGGTNIAMGVAPIVVTTNDYFWLQTYGPCEVKCAAVAGVGDPCAAGVTGQVMALATTDGAVTHTVGYAMQICTASERGLIFLQLAP